MPNISVNIDWSIIIIVSSSIDIVLINSINISIDISRIELGGEGSIYRALPSAINIDCNISIGISISISISISIGSISIGINTDSRIELGGVRSIYWALPSARLRGKGLGTNLAGGKNNFEVRRGKGNI